MESILHCEPILDVTKISFFQNSFLSEKNRDVSKKTLNISSSLNLQKPFPKRICSQHVQLWKKKISGQFLSKMLNQAIKIW